MLLDMNEADLNYWQYSLENKTTRELEVIQKVVEVMLQERDKVKYGNSQRGNRVESGLQAA